MNKIFPNDICQNRPLWWGSKLVGWLLGSFFSDGHVCLDQISYDCQTWQSRKRDISAIAKMTVENRLVAGFFFYLLVLARKPKQSPSKSLLLTLCSSTSRCNAVSMAPPRWRGGRRAQGWTTALLCLQGRSSHHDDSAWYERGGKLLSFFIIKIDEHKFISYPMGSKKFWPKSMALALDHDSTKLSKCAQEHWICFLCTFLPLHILVVVIEWQMFWNCAKWHFLWQPVTMLDSYPMLWNIPFHAKGNQLWYVSCGSTVTWPK